MTRQTMVLLLTLVTFHQPVLSDAFCASQAQAGAAGAKAGSPREEFDRLRIEGNEALYDLDYNAARDSFKRMTEIAPDHPAGFVYLANCLWLETLYSSRRLSSSLYASSSFYAQSKDSDKVDPKRDREFNGLIKQALAVGSARLQKQPKDAEALYYQGSALGLRAAYGASVARSFTRAIGDANDSIVILKQVVKLNPNYVDAYLSIGFYEYVIDSLPWAWRLLARVAGLKGSKTKGIELLQMVAQKGKYASDDARVLLMAVYNREGKLDRALEITSQLSSKYPNNYLFSVELGGLLFRIGRRDDGERIFAELVKNDRVARSNSDLVNYQWGEALSNVKDHSAAIERYKEVIRWQKSDPSLVSLAHLHAGQAFDALGKRTEAVAEYRVVLKRESIFDSHQRANEYLKKAWTPGAKQ